jgi:hypothetical protein
LPHFGLPPLSLLRSFPNRRKKMKRAETEAYSTPRKMIVGIMNENETFLNFWKSVTAVTIAEIIVFSVVGAVTYVYVGNQYMIWPMKV